jgi:cbb3-type cytochrome oxidase subunit 3
MPFITWLTQYTVVAVVAVFLLIVITTFWPGRRERMERDAMIPFQDDR